MMKKKYILTIVAALVAAAILVYFFAGTELRKEVKPEAQAPASTQSAPAGGHEGHGGEKGTPSQAPPESAGQGEAPTVEITPEKQQLIGVKTVPAAVRPLLKAIRTVGRIEYDERKLRTVNTKVEGWIEKLYIDYTGRYVQKGEAMAELYSPELVATQEEFLNILKWKGEAMAELYSPELVATQEEFLNILKWRKETTADAGTGAMLSRDTEALVEAARKRLQRFDISEAQIRELEQTGKARRTLTIYSPANGYVVQKMALQGMRVMPGEKLFDVADLSTVWVIADVYEYELSSIRVGETASIGLSYIPGQEFKSKIDYVYPTLSGETTNGPRSILHPQPRWSAQAADVQHRRNQDQPGKQAGHPR